MTTKLTKLDEAASLDRLVALGVDTPPPETPPAVVTITENELPVVASAADIAHLRAVGAEGDSVIATPLQLRELVGIDYSKLEEQVVPGEWWLGEDGVKRQVYVRTFVGTMPQPITDLEIIIARGVFSESAIVTGILGGMPPNWDVLGHSLYWTVRSTPDSLRIGVPSIAESLLSGASYSVTIKYTKR